MLRHFHARYAVKTTEWTPRLRVRLLQCLKHAVVENAAQ